MPVDAVIASDGFSIQSKRISILAVAVLSKSIWERAPFGFPIFNAPNAKSGILLQPQNVNAADEDSTTRQKKAHLRGLSYGRKREDSSTNLIANVLIVQKIYRKIQRVAHAVMPISNM